MNWLDITLLCLAGIGLVKGLFDGVIKQVVSLIALLVAIFFCGKAAAWLREYLIALDWFPSEGATILSYVLGFMLIAGVVLLAGDLLHRLVGATPLGILNHLAGGVFGLGFMLLFLSLVFNVMDVVDRGAVLIPDRVKTESRFYRPIKEIIPTIYPHDLFSR